MAISGRQRRARHGSVRRRPAYVWCSPYPRQDRLCLRRRGGRRHPALAADINRRAMLSGPLPRKRSIADSRYMCRWSMRPASVASVSDQSDPSKVSQCRARRNETARSPTNSTGPGPPWKPLRRSRLAIGQVDGHRSDPAGKRGHVVERKRHNRSHVQVEALRDCLRRFGHSVLRMDDRERPTVGSEDEVARDRGDRHRVARAPPTNDEDRVGRRSTGLTVLDKYQDRGAVPLIEQPVAYIDDGDGERSGGDHRSGDRPRGYRRQ